MITICGDLGGAGGVKARGGSARASEFRNASKPSASSAVEGSKRISTELESTGSTSSSEANSCSRNSSGAEASCSTGKSGSSSY